MKKIMHKKCTESKCRKTFSYEYDAINVVCPYCGKAYPRLSDVKKVFCIINGKKYDMTWIKEYDKSIKYDIVRKLHHDLLEEILLKGNVLLLSLQIVEYFLNQKTMPSQVFVKAELSGQTWRLISITS